MKSSIACLVAAAAFLSTINAAAEWTARPKTAAIISFDGGPAAGGIFGIALGYNPELEPLIIIPEAVFEIGPLGSHPAVISRALAGVRAGVAGPVEPALLLRGGYGNLLGRTDLHGGVFDVGLALDYRIERWFAIGAELTYDLFLYQSAGLQSLSSLEIGTTAAFAF